MTTPRSWPARFPETRTKAWILSWAETSDRVQALMALGPLGNRPAREQREEVAA